MVNYFRIVVFFGFVAFFAMGCSTAETKSESAKQGSVDSKQSYSSKIKLDQSGYFEKCENMSLGNKLVYSFKVLKPVNFNIHYHVRTQIFYPITKDGILSLEGTFYPEKKQMYCLMWTNPHSEIVTLFYDFKVMEE